MKSCKEICEELYSQLEENIRLHDALQQVIHTDTPRPDLALVQAVCTAARSETGRITIAHNAAVWDAIPEPTLGFLAAFIRNPTGLDIAPFLGNVLILSDPDEESVRTNVEFYIRHGPVKDPITCWMKYLGTHPADSAFMIMQLILCGAELTDIRRAFVVRMARSGFDDDVDTLFQAIAEDKRFHHLIKRTGKHISNPGLTAQAYMGFSEAHEVALRFIEDMKSQSKRRFPNYAHTNESNIVWSTYRFLQLTQVASPSEIRSHVIISQIESILIDCGCGRLLNSAHGGVIPQRIHSPELIYLRAAVDALCPRQVLPLGDSKPHALIKRLKADVKQEAHLFENAVGPRLCKRSMQTIHQIGPDATRAEGNQVMSMMITKDVPKEDAEGTFGGFWCADAGPGPQLERHQRTLIYPEIPMHTDLSEDTIATFIGNTCDLFSHVDLQDHEQYLKIHVILLSRRIITTNPLFVEIVSELVAAIFTQGGLREGWDDITEELRDRILSGETPLDILSNMDQKTKTTTNLRQGRFIALMGRLFVVPTGFDGQTHLTLATVRGHPGRDKYQPLLQRLRFDLDAAVLLVSDLVKNVNIDCARRGDKIGYNGTTRMEYHLETKRIVEDILAESGVTKYLEETRAKLSRREMVYGQLKFLSSRSAQRLDSLREEGWHVQREGSHNPGNDRQDDEEDCNGEEYWDDKDKSQAEYLNHTPLVRRTLPTLTIGPPQSALRLHQLNDIVENAQFLHQGGNNPDPRRLCPRGLAISSIEFKTWIMSLREGISISASARGGAVSQANRVISNANLRLNPNALKQKGLRDRPDVAGVSPQMADELDSRQQNLQRAVSALSDPRCRRVGQKTNGQIGMIETWRWGCLLNMRRNCN